MSSHELGSKPPAELVVETRTSRRTALVALRGELDLVTVSKVAEVLSDLRPGADPDAAVPGLRAHLEGCPACREDHDSLFAYVSGRGEADG